MCACMHMFVYVCARASGRMCVKRDTEKEIGRKRTESNKEMVSERRIYKDRGRIQKKKAKCCMYENKYVENKKEGEKEEKGSEEKIKRRMKELHRQTADKIS